MGQSEMSLAMDQQLSALESALSAVWRGHYGKRITSRRRYRLIVLARRVLLPFAEEAATPSVECALVCDPDDPHRLTGTFTLSMLAILPEAPDAETK